MRHALLLALLATALWGQSQPIEFSHRIHAGTYKLNCLHCHSGARRSTVAGIPSVAFCMGCHRMAAVAKPEIARLRAYYDNQTPLRWARIVKQPDYVFFNHSPHVAKGIRCQQCHGAIETMARVRLDHTLSMTVCVDCHRRNGASTDCYTCHR
jgi:hypothetical protein